MEKVKKSKNAVESKGVTVTETPMNGLMALAGNNMVVKPSAKKDDHEIILVKDNKEVAASITALITNKAIMDAAKNAMDQANGVVKNYAQAIQLEELNRSGRLKDSFILSNEEGKSAMYMVKDAYTCDLKTKEGKPDLAKIAELKKQFGDDIIATENKFVINADLVEKYGNVLYEFIMKSEKIEAEDKVKLIQLEQKNTIAKGSVDKISALAKFAKTTVDKVWNIIQPIQALSGQGKNKK